MSAATRFAAGFALFRRQDLRVILVVFFVLSLIQDDGLGRSFGWQCQPIVVVGRQRQAFSVEVIGQRQAIIDTLDADGFDHDLLHASDFRKLGVLQNADAEWVIFDHNAGRGRPLRNGLDGCGRR